MESSTHTVSSLKGRIWAGRILSALPVLFLLFDGVIHIMRIPAVVEGFAKAGFPIYVAVFIWGGLWLRDNRVRSLIPVRSS